jgi:hypothetical protein
MSYRWTIPQLRAFPSDFLTGGAARGVDFR